jgi:hypothetical protein
MTTARAALVREVKARPEFEVRGTKMEARPSGRLPLVRGETVLVLPMDSPAAGETVELLVDLEREKLPVTLGERVILPSSAFDRERGQYRAESLLALVAARDGRRILAVTGRDLYAEGQDGKTSFLALPMLARMLP